MNILLIDTATNIEITAIRYRGAIADRTIPTRLSHSVTLFDNIDKACKDLHAAISNIDCIGVGIGPGSFTGIRIAVTTARMLAQILSIPLVGVPTQLLFASAIVHSSTDCIVAFDAKKSRVFAARYRIANHAVPKEIIPPGDYSVAQLFADNDETPVIAVGDGALKYKHEMAALHRNIQCIPDFIPDAHSMLSLVEQLYSADPQQYIDYRTIVPDYARKSDAEVMKALKEGNG